MLSALAQAEGPSLLWIQETVRCALLDPLMMLYTQLGNAGLLWIALCVLMLAGCKGKPLPDGMEEDAVLAAGEAVVQQLSLIHI